MFATDVIANKIKMLLSCDYSYIYLLFFKINYNHSVDKSFYEKKI